jgi:chromosome segregation ATPase
MLQRLDRSEKELGAVREKVQEFEAQDALNAARVKFVDKNMQDLEFLLEHAVQREEKALRREKQALAALQETKKSSENALGQGLPHEVALMHEYLHAAEHYCNTLETLFRRCSNAARSKDILADKLRAQLDRSEEQMQVWTSLHGRSLLLYAVHFGFVCCS